MSQSSKKVGSALVVGGGIGGMQAALDLAESGIKVYLTDTKPCIGGVMSQLDKTFPTNDCAMCTMAPRLVEIGRHKDIEIITLADIQDISDEPGNFTVTLKKRARYIDESKCTGCGECVEKCPIEIPSDYNTNLDNGKAIYRRYPQAIPNFFAIQKLGRSPCTFNCPAEQKVQGYIALIREKRYEDAFRVIQRDNPLPSVCGRVCVHRCEDECTRKQIDEPVSIMALKRFVADWAYENKIKPTLPDREEDTEVSSKRVAVIGSGPAGLTAAYDLRTLGHAVTVFEALPVAGGMMRVGIPDYRLPPERLEWDIQNILASGVELKTGERVDDINSLLGDGYDAVFVAAGAHKGYTMGIPGEDADGVIDGIEFLRKVNLGEEVRIGDKVMVIGGGNTAIDAARVARRLGKDVTILYRRTRVEMPAQEEEVEEAIHEGVEIQFLAAPVKVVEKNGTIESVECIKMELGEMDASGRRRPVPIEGSNFTLSIDTLIPAIGQAPDLSFSNNGDIELAKRGTIEADPQTLTTSRDGVFAGGDAVTGPTFVIDAVAAGHRAAESIDLYLKGQPLEREERKPAKVELTLNEARKKIKSKEGRQKPPLASGEVRKGFSEVQLVYTEEQALAEAERCLNCGICSECLLCVESCKVEAVDHDMPPETSLELNVGAVILSPGYELFSANTRLEYGYWKHTNVVTALEFERILSATGPYLGKVLRPSDKQPPKKIAFVQCVASRDEKRNYCSSICCMYATKEAIIAKEHAGEELECHVYYMDLRAFGKGFEDYYERAKKLGVKYIRCRPSAIDEIEDSRLRIHHVSDEDKVVAEDYDMVVLSMGMGIPQELRDLSSKLGIMLNEHGFCRTGAFSPVESSREGVFVCGPFTEPKDIPETVMQASGAASKALSLLSEVRGTLITTKEFPPEKDVSGDAPRIGVFVCHCGTNIAGVVDVPAVVEYAKTLPDVVYAENNLYTCSNDTQEKIKELIEEHQLNRVIVASCTPRTHEPLFRNTIREAGLNPYLFEMANIRDQCSWVHMHEPKKATRKSKDLVRMAVAKARMIESLYSISMPVKSGALVIGGGMSGMTAALNLAEQGFDVNLVEREAELGGNLRHVHSLLGGDDPQENLKETIRKIEEHPNVKVWTESKIAEIEGFIGNFKTTIEKDGKETEIEHGVVIVASGAKEFTPTEYMYGSDDRVITQHVLEERLSKGEFDAKRVVMIQCVGSREDERMYCSRICCSQAVKNALKIKEDYPDADVFILYREIRTYGFSESYYTEARKKGIRFVRYELEQKPAVSANNGRLRIETPDPVLRSMLEIDCDLIVLAPAIVPYDDVEDIAKMLKVPLTKEKFFLEAHMKLRPVDFATEGVFLCGLAHAPKSVEESIAQAMGAASRASTVLSKDEMELEAMISEIIDANCDGCAYCIDPCPFNALTLIEYMRNGAIKKTVERNEALCQGCGVCMATCPKQGIFVRNFRLEQIEAMVNAALEVV